MSNSKLDSCQKSDRKYMLSEFTGDGGEIFSFPDLGATIAIIPEFPGSNMSRMSVSICSFDEDKFRRKVGEFYALDKMFNCEFVRVPTPNMPDYFAEAIAETFGAF